jgi:exoribonuclease-2
MIDIAGGRADRDRNKGVDHTHPSIDLQQAAVDAMRAHGFDPDFAPPVLTQLADLAAHPPRAIPGPEVRDLRALPWSSIDNDTSRDLDQLEVVELLPDAATRVLVAIADVDAFVPIHSPIDAHAGNATTTVYTGVRNFPMLPDALSTQATSLLEGPDHSSIVIEFVVADGGVVRSSDVYRAIVRNTAQLTYDGVGAWLEGHGPAPAKVGASAVLQTQLQQQDACARALRGARFRHGALNIETIETRPIVLRGEVVDVVRQDKNRATDLIEDFMIAANEVVARMLEARGVSSIRRVVKTPERWDRIVALAESLGEGLPAAPDSKALNDFLIRRRTAAPDRFADLSLAVIKLMGPGEYVLERPGDPNPGHFGLAIEDYTHSTAPNRRFADLVTQRLIKATLAALPSSYPDEELAAIARNCTQKENASRKVEREMSKRIAASSSSG